MSVIAMRRPAALGGILVAAVLAAGGVCASAPPRGSADAALEGTARPDAVRAPDVVLQGTLTGADHQSYRNLPFEVPEGTTRITVQFEYDGRERKTTIDLGLLGPDGFRGQDGLRGWSGGNKAVFTVAANDATPSYQSGPIRSGRWALLLGIPNIRKQTRARYTARIWFSRAEAVYGESLPSDPVLRSGPGWYRGDLHLHNAHSDGSCDSLSGRRVPCPLFLTVQAAAARGLDFVAITDHNTVTQANALRELQPYFDRLLLMPGREITTFQGHANLWGSVAPLDFRVTGSRSWNALLRDVSVLGGVVSINHPVRPSDESCMGCGWTPREGMDLSLVQAMEVVNGGDADTPYSGIPFWEALLNRGLRLTAVGGSDNHDAGLVRATPGGAPVGTPTTVIHAEALSVPGLLAGLRAGNVFVDVQGTRDRALELTAISGNVRASMGDVLVAPAGRRIDFEAAATASAGGRVEVIVDGRPYAVTADLQVKQPRQLLRFAWSADGRRHWLRVDVRGPDGRLWLLGNPIYLHPGGSLGTQHPAGIGIGRM